MSALRILACLSLVSLLGLAGCSVNRPAQLYQLDTGSSSVPTRDNGVAVLLGPVQLADYLQRETMVQRQADGILNLSSDARWAGSLQTNVSQQLLRQLSSQLDSTRLALFPEKPGFAPQVQVMLDISRLDSGPKEPAVLDARWRLLDQKGALRDSRVFHQEEKHDGSIKDQVRAQSDLLRRLAEQLAGDVRPVAVAIEQPPAPRKQPTAVAEQAAKPKEEGPKMPLVVPIRNDVEVFRF
ncbi:PqiC family protein [Pseudomonas knackmussii]|uniref:PqiC family protein n=1 Tax=Pseudomonas knackmussii TaxID=65741 RepID=UPI001363593C|nr:ABC-type transport auxiliary lipoprotein family protein [Pseudomonas knackmussii]